jgi:xylulokinase
MARRILLGIDLGTTRLKAAAVDTKAGRPLAACSAKLPVRAAEDGTREQDLSAVDQALRRVVRKLRRGLGERWGQVAGVGVAAQGGSAILVDRGTGRPHTAMQLWNDTRPLGLLTEIAARKPGRYWRDLTHLPSPGAGLARICWLRERRPELFKEGNLYVGAGEYVYFHLTGVWRQDAGNALQTGCYDVRRHRLAPGPLRLVGVDPAFVAPMRRGHETHPLQESGAKLLALPAGLPVAGPYIDHEAAYQAAAGVSTWPLLCSLGTAWVGSYVQQHTAPPDGALSLVLPSPTGRGDLVLRVMRAGTGTWDWALATLLSGSPRSALARAEAVFQEKLLPPEGLLALPWVTGRNLVDPACAGGGGFVGIGPHTTRADLLRAVAAGMCFELAHTLGPVLASDAIDSVVLCGGAAAGWYFRALLAALLAPRRVLWLENDQTVAACGAVQSLRASPAGARARRVGLPSVRLQERVQAGYLRYRRLCQALADGLRDQSPSVLDGYRQRKSR